MVKHWISGVVKDINKKGTKGLFTEYIRNKYGSKGFNKDGTIKMSIVYRETKSKNILVKKRAVLAKTFKSINH